MNAYIRVDQPAADMTIKTAAGDMNLIDQIAKGVEQAAAVIKEQEEAKVKAKAKEPPVPTGIKPRDLLLPFLMVWYRIPYIYPGIHNMHCHVCLL